MTTEPNDDRRAPSAPPKPCCTPAALESCCDPQNKGDCCGSEDKPPERCGCQ